MNMRTRGTNETERLKFNSNHNNYIVIFIKGKPGGCEIATAEQFVINLRGNIKL